MLVEKTESDDSLIEALSEELRKVSKESAEFERKYKESALNASGRPLREVVAGKGGSQLELSSATVADPGAELARLRRLVAQQVRHLFLCHSFSARLVTC